MLNSHKQIIKHREVVEDDWSVLRLDEGQTADTFSVPEGKIIVPLAVWLAAQPAFRLEEVWWLSVLTVWLQGGASYLLLRQQFRRRLVDAPRPAVPLAAPAES